MPPPVTAAGDDSNAFPLDLYLERVRCSASFAPNERSLVVLQLAQLSSIPFENFDVLLGREILLTRAALVEKLLCKPRGGYCFELNTLFLTALRAIGFDARPILARVHLGGDPSAHTHELVLVELAGRSWIADAGFGAPALRAPIPLELGSLRPQLGDTFRLVDAGAFGTMLQRQRGDGWLDLYSFNLNTVIAADIELGNHFTATHPSSRFTASRIAAIHTPTGRTTLQDLLLRLVSENVVSESTLTDGEEFFDALLQCFGIELDIDRDALPPVAGRRFDVAFQDVNL